MTDSILEANIPFLTSETTGQSTEPVVKLHNAARLVDYALAQRAADGDIEAFEKIYWQYHRRVFAICMRMVKDESTAEDITQQVFINLFRRIKTFRGEAAFSTWLHRTTVNQVLMYFRAQRARKESTTEDGEMPETSSVDYPRPTVPSPIDRIDLANAIKKLPRGYRKILIMHDIKGYQHDEIARILGCSSGTSKSQLFKARLKLRSILAAEEKFPLRETHETA